MAAAVLARYDGSDLPDVDEAAVVELEGEGEVNLRKLVVSMMQFVTSDDLQSKCVGTTDAAFVADLRTWVGSGGDDSTEAARRLHGKLDVLVKGRPFHSHSAERAVGLGVRLGRKHGTHITDSHSSATLCAKSNGTMADIRNAACEYERELQARRQAENGRPAPDAPWVGDEAEPIKRKRPASTAYRNKAVIGKCALNAEKRAARVPAANMAAYEHSGRASAAGVDIESRDNKRKRDQEAALKAAASERGANAQMVHYDRAEMTRRAKLVVMPRLQIGLIDLDTAVTKKKPAVDELIDECEAREIAVPRTRSGGRKTAGKDSQGTKIDKAYYVSLLRAANGGKRYLKMQSDEAAKAAAWAGDDDEYGGGGGSSDDDMDDDDEPHIPL